MLEMPETVSIVTGNQTASAMRPIAESVAVRRATTMARGIHAVAGIGPDHFQDRHAPVARRGEPADQTPVTSPSSTPST